VLAREIPRGELAQRRDALRAKARERGLDGVVVWSRGGPAVDYYGDILYLTNHFAAVSAAEPDTELWSGRSHSALILPVEGDPVLIVDIPEFDEASMDIHDVRPSMHVAIGVAEALRDTGLADGKIGLVGRHVFLANHQEMIFEFLGKRIAWTPFDDVLAAMRSVKSDAELVLMRKAADVGVGWISSMMDAAVPGATEGAVAAAGLSFMAENGGIPADIDIASGPNAHRLKSRFALPSWDPTRVLERGDLFHVDGWGSVGGYYTDTVRTTAVGATPTADQLRIIDGTIELIDELISIIRPGLACSDLNQHGTDWMRANGFADLLDGPADGPGDHQLHLQMWPYFGHGLGLGIEAPWLTRESEVVLEKNMVLAVEVYFNAPNGELAGFEENIVVGGDVPENLTSALRRRWWE
jgi:Xaa-Pro dipeptidase